MQPSTTKTQFRVRGLFTAFCVLLAVVPWGIVLASSSRGFDLTDESFYVLSIAHPENVSATFSMFGAVLNPLYNVVGGNITKLRIFSILILFFVSTLVTWLTVRVFERNSPAMPNRTFVVQRRILLTLLVSATSTLYYALWLLTPSYNWLALTGLTAFWGGFLLWLSSHHRTWRARLGVGIFACAAAIVFWAKPTSAALVAFYPLVAVILMYRQWRRLLDPHSLLAGAIGFAFGISVPLWHGMSIQDIITILSQGIEHQNLMKPGEYNSIISTIGQGFVEIGKTFAQNLYPTQYFLVWFVPLVLTLLIAQASTPSKVKWRAAKIVLCVGFVVNLITVTYVLSENIGHWSLNVLLLSAVYLLTGHYTDCRIAKVSFTIKQWRLVIWLFPIIGLVFVFAFGSTNPYVFQSAMAAHFYLLGTAVLFLTVKERSVNALLMWLAVPTLLGATIWLISINSLTPYRQDVPIWNMNQSISLDDGTNTLLVSNEMERYIQDLRTLAATSGMEPGTPFIDLSGHSPGVSYVLQARPYVFPWLLGNYPGSDTGAIFILKHWETEQLASAWILTATESEAPPLSLTVLAAVGLSFPDDYIQVGVTHLPDSNEIHTLWRPKETTNAS